MAARQLQIGAEYRIIEELRGGWLPSQRVRIMAQLPSADLEGSFIRAEVVVLSGSHSGQRLTISARVERVHERPTCNCLGKVYPHRRGDRDCLWKENALCYCGLCGSATSAVEVKKPQHGHPARTELRSKCHDAQVFRDPELTHIYDPWRT